MLNFSKWVWLDIVNFQWAWWNISYKEDGILYIKASWYKIDDIHKQNAISKIDIGWFFIDLEKETNLSEENLNKIIKSNNLSELKPSIETGFHLLLDSKYVIHTHNVYINTILCSNESEEILSTLFWNTIDILDYKSPWLWLFEEMKTRREYSEVIFLKNHWIIIHWNTWFDDLYEKINKIEQKIVSYLKLEKFVHEKEYKIVEKHLFPDTVVLEDLEVYSAHKYIENQIIKIGKQVKPLHIGDVAYIRNMSSEKYRKNILKKNWF